MPIRIGAAILLLVGAVAHLAVSFGLLDSPMYAEVKLVSAWNSILVVYQYTLILSFGDSRVMVNVYFLVVGSIHCLIVDELVHVLRNPS